MEWWSILGYVIGIPAGIYFSLRLRSVWAERREKQRKAIDQLRENFFSTEQTIKQWDSLHGSYVYENGSSLSLIQWLEKETESKDIPQKLHKRVKEIIECLYCYEKWLDESRYIIRAEIEQECEKKRKPCRLMEGIKPI